MDETTDTKGPIAPEPSLEEKLQAAKLAMEGPEYTAKREAREREEIVKSQHDKIEARLKEISKQKELLESQWIELDDKRNVIKQALSPLLEEETKAEQAESALEESEKASVVSSDRQKIEQSRYEIQATRRKIEEGKWGLENEITTIEAAIEKNTAEYRVLLDEEDKLHTELTNLSQTPDEHHE